jgi:hypothetical protein
MNRKNIKKHLIVLLILICCLLLGNGIVKVGLGWHAILILGIIHLYVFIYNLLNKK